MTATAGPPLQIADLERLLRAADPPAVLVTPWALRRIIKRTAGAAGFGVHVPHRHSYVLDGDTLARFVNLAVLGLEPGQPLPAKVVGLPISVQQVRASGFVMLGVFTAAFITIAVFYFARGWARRMTLAVFGIVSKRLGEKLAETAPAFLPLKLPISPAAYRYLPLG